MVLSVGEVLGLVAVVAFACMVGFAVLAVGIIAKVPGAIVRALREHQRLTGAQTTPGPWKDDGAREVVEGDSVASQARPKKWDAT